MECLQKYYHSSSSRKTWLFRILIQSHYNSPMSDPPLFSKPTSCRNAGILSYPKPLVSLSAAIQFVDLYLIEADQFQISSRIQLNFVTKCLFSGLYGDPSRFQIYAWLSLTSSRSGRSESDCSESDRHRCSPTASCNPVVSRRPKATELTSTSPVNVAVEVCFLIVNV